MKLPPVTATAAFCVRLSLASVSQGVTEVEVMPVKLKVWLTADVFALMAMMMY